MSNTPAPSGDRAPLSLKAEMVDWMLAPLAVLWPVAVAVSYALGLSIAEGPFDRDLRERVRALAEDVVKLPAGERVDPALQRSRGDPGEHVLARVVGPNGEQIAGDTLIPAPRVDECVQGAIRFRDVVTEVGEVRVACQRVAVAREPYSVAVQVAEPVDRRREHATQVTLMVMGVVLILVPLILLLVAFGLLRGLAPLRRLRERIEARDPDDLSPIPETEAPSELAPLVTTLNRQLERVRASLASQRRFVADAAHQLRTPLAALKTQAQVGRSARTLEEADERLERIGESADHLGRLATQLLVLARADDARVDPSGTVDLSATVRVACHDIADAAIAKSIRLALDVPETELRVRGDADLLHELFVNLIDNAVRYTPPGGEVVVRAYAAPDPVVEVEDDGPGIPEAERELVFERFYRVLGTGVAGSGLGLPIVRSIAQRHGATVEVEAGPNGRGTRLRVRFAPRVNP